MNEALSTLPSKSEVDTIAKKVANLEAGVSGELFTIDDATAYVKSIPADVAPYAELRSVGGMVHAHQLPPPNLFKASVLDAENNRTYYDENYNVEPIIYANNGVYTIDQVNYTYGSVIYVTAATVRELFPNAVAGKKYTFSYDAEGESGTGIYFTGGASYDIFTMTEAMLDGHLEMYGAETYDPDGGMYWPTSATYSNISLTEVGGGERYLTEAKVTALDIVGKNLFDCENAAEIRGACEVASRTKNSITVRSTRIAAYMSTNFELPDWLEGKTITFSTRWSVSGGATPHARIVWMRDGQNAMDIINLVDSGQARTNTIPAKPSNGTHLAVCLHASWAQENTSAGDSVTYTDLQIEISGAPTTYSPYHKHTFAIPEAVQAMDGYGWGIPNGAHNGVEWDDEGRPTFVKRVKRVEFNGTEGWAIGSSANLGQYFQLSARDGATAETVCSHTFDRAYLSGGTFVFFVGAIASTVDEWKLYLSKQYANGTPVVMYYELKEPIVTDISHLITDDNLVPVEGGGVIVAQNENEEAAPSTIIYPLRA